MKKILILLSAVLIILSVNIQAAEFVSETDFAKLVCNTFGKTLAEYKRTYPSTGQTVKYNDAVRIIVTEIGLRNVAELEGGYPEGYNYLAGILGIAEPGIITDESPIALTTANEILGKVKYERADDIKRYKEYVFFYSKIDKLKTKFPDKTYWNHDALDENNPDGYTTVPCVHDDEILHGNCNEYDGTCGCNAYDRAIQCYGFALKIANELTGTNARAWKRHNDFDSLSLGDIVMFAGHYMVVIKKDSDGINVLEANYDRCCRIDWNRRIEKETLEKYMTPENMKNGSAFYMTPAVNFLYFA